MPIDLRPQSVAWAEDGGLAVFTFAEALTTGAVLTDGLSLYRDGVPTTVISAASEGYELRLYTGLEVIPPSTTRLAYDGDVGDVTFAVEGACPSFDVTL